MANNNENLQYNSCVSKGICSINPRISALQNVLGLYLHLCAKYCLKLLEKKSLNVEIQDFFINTVAMTVSNPEFTENCFMEVIIKLKEILPKLIATYNQIYNKEDFKGEDILASDLFKRSSSIVEAIKLGEYIFKTKIAQIPSIINDLFKILMTISKSMSINLLDLQSYGVRDETAFQNLLLIFNAISPDNKEENLKELIYNTAKCNTELMETLHIEQEKRYGKQRVVDISYTTKSAKAILVVGSNIKELETILETVGDSEIDVYTHDEMMVAHTFPKFSEYKNLKGQFGHGIENCLIDFATFPGPIILTKHSLHNVENLYRGRLYTTDDNFYKGVIKIEDNDYREVIKSALDSKGFKKGKVCETVTVGYDYSESTKLIDEKLKHGKYKKVVIIGLKDFSKVKEDYFAKLVKLISEDILIISFSYNFEKENLLYFNTCFDSYAVVRIVSYILKNYEIHIDIFLPKCGKNTLTEMIHFSKFDRNRIFMGDCEPIIINPSVQNTLREVFNIRTISSPKKDLKMINELSKE